MPQDFQDVTVAIVARNAAKTIGRAVTSALAAGAQNILLVDDASDDDTSSIALDAGGGALTIVRNETAVSVGHARGLALEHIKTPYGVWLDADDAFAPEHLELITRPLRKDGVDIVYPACTLLDGASSDVIKPIAIPEFMTVKGGILRSFERNWLPVLTGAFKMEAARKIGFDASFTCAEDYDFLLRAIAGDLLVGISPEPSYHYYHYGSSISRNRQNTADFTGKALKKHASAWLKVVLTKSGYAGGDIDCMLASKAMFEGDFDAALEAATKAAASPDPVVPYGASASHVAAFFAGTAAAKRGFWTNAVNILEPLGSHYERPEVFNNLAVAFAECGDRFAAGLSLELALALNSDYLDAHTNKKALTDGAPLQAITTHPLRVEASRDKYTE